MALLPTQYVGPYLALVLLAHVHPFLFGARDAHHASKSKGVIPCTKSRPADTLRIIKVIPLYAVRIELPCKAHVWKFAATTRGERMIPFDAIYIAVENTWISFSAKKDERVGERLEERLDYGLKGLIWLSVMICDQRDWRTSVFPLRIWGHGGRLPAFIGSL